MEVSVKKYQALRVILALMAVNMKSSEAGSAAERVAECPKVFREAAHRGGRARLWHCSIVPI